MIETSKETPFHFGKQTFLCVKEILISVLPFDVFIANRGKWL